MALKPSDGVLPAEYPKQRCWKFWTSNTIDGLNVRIMSRLNENGTFTMAIVWDRDDKGKRWALKEVKDDGEVVRTAEELMETLPMPGVIFTLRDFTDCDTLPKFVEKFTQAGLTILKKEGFP